MVMPEDFMLTAPLTFGGKSISMGANSQGIRRVVRSTLLMGPLDNASKAKPHKTCSWRRGGPEVQCIAGDGVGWSARSKRYSGQPHSPFRSPRRWFGS